jgi:hypothetical protein
MEIRVARVSINQAQGAGELSPAQGPLRGQSTLLMSVQSMADQCHEMIGDIGGLSRAGRGDAGACDSWKPVLSFRNR